MEAKEAKVECRQACATHVVVLAMVAAVAGAADVGSSAGGRVAVAGGAVCGGCRKAGCGGCPPRPRGVSGREIGGRRRGRVRALEG